MTEPTFHKIEADYTHGLGQHTAKDPRAEIQVGAAAGRWFWRIECALGDRGRTGPLGYWSDTPAAAIERMSRETLEAAFAAAVAELRAYAEQARDDGRREAAKVLRWLDAAAPPPRRPKLKTYVLRRNR